MDQAAGKLRALLTLWHQVRDTRPMPARGDLPASVLRPWLANLCLIDLSVGAPCFRRCGIRLRRRFGSEMTGLGLDALREEHGAHGIALHLGQVRRALAPVQAVHGLPEPRGMTLFRDLYLPLSAGGQQAGMVLFASYEAG